MDDLYQNQRIFSNDIKDIGGNGDILRQVAVIKPNEIIADMPWTY